MRTGKYGHLIDKLPRLLREEPARQEKLTALKQSILTASDDGIAWEKIERHLHVIQQEYAIVADLLLRAGGSRRYASVFARVYRWLRQVKDIFKEQESDIQLLLDANGQLLVDQYEVEDTNTIKLQTGESVRVQWEPHAAVMDREAFRQWIIANGMGRSLSLPWQTTNAITKDLLLKGLPEPDGVVAHANYKIVVTKG